MKRCLALVLASLCSAQSSETAQLEKEITGYIRLLTDWGGLVRYGSENAELRAPKPGENRVVFLGDDITEKWGDEFFAERPYLNRGIAKQTTPQMLVRFRQDVISLKPKVVVIQGGSNDYAGYAGPATEGTITENITTMVELAKLHGIAVVLSSVTPVCDCAGKILTERRPAGKLIGLNGWLRDYAKQNGLGYVDYYAALAKGREFNKDLTVDGLIPNRAGYALMAPLAEQAIQEALRPPK